MSILIVYFFFQFGLTGFNSFQFVEPDLGIENLGTDQDVESFTSFTDSIVFIIKGNENLISENVWNWTSFFAFDLQNNDLIEKFAVDSTPIQNIFSSTQQILTPYYTSTHFAIGAFNLTTYLLIEGTKTFLDVWSNQNNPNLAQHLSETKNISLSLINTNFTQLSFSFLFEEFVGRWVQQLVDYVNGTLPGEIQYENVVNSWKLNPDFWKVFENPIIQVAFEYLLNNVSVDLSWENDKIYPILSEFLYGDSSQESVNFLDSVFDNGKNPTQPVISAREMLIPFLRGENSPFGFPDKIRSFYLQSFTNSDGTSPATSMIIRYQIRSDLNATELEQLFIEMEKIAISETQENPFGYTIAFFSVLNYERERSNDISEEMHRVDLIAIIIGTIILFYFIRNPILTIITIGAAYMGSLIAKGIIISLLPLIGSVNGTGFSMTTTILLGAGLNYSVFFTYRYVNERDNGKDHDEALEIAVKQALHSIIISAIAVALVMVPYIPSFFETLRDFSKTVVLGVLLQMIFLVILLPVLFHILEPLKKYLKKTNIEQSQARFLVTKFNSKKILFTAIALGVLALIIILSFNSTIETNDFIGDEGQTGIAKKILEEDFPDNYLSKILFTINYNYTILTPTQINQTSMDLISELTSKINSTTGVSLVVSPAWPLGSPFNYSDQSIGFIDKEAGKTAALQLINPMANTTYIILQLVGNPNDPEVSSIVKQLFLISDEFSEKYDFFIILSGIPVESYSVSKAIFSELPLQFAVAVILLTLFLWWQLKSLTVPLRLQFTILLGNLYGMLITSILYILIFEKSLNLIIVTSSIMILLGLGTDFDIYIYRRIQEEFAKGESFYDSIKIGIQKSGSAVRASGLVMAFSFLSLYQSNLDIIRQFAILSFLSIIFDIFIIRLLVVPAILIVGNKKLIDEDPEKSI